MNFKKFINSDYLKENPLCGIDTYKDELNLSTGACTRRIKKLVLTGNENVITEATIGDTRRALIKIETGQGGASIPLISTHYGYDYGFIDNTAYIGNVNPNLLYINDNAHAKRNADFKTYLTQQYTNGTPVTVWYVLETPTTETITVPSGLSGTVEGYLNQSGTPTPTNPIYPTANTVEQWFDLNHYIMGTATDTITTLPAVLYPTGITATVGLKGNAVQSSGTTTVPSKSVTVSSLESGTDYALFPKVDFPNAVVGDTINIVVGGTSYSQKVMKIDTSYVYIENRTV